MTVANEVAKIGPAWGNGTNRVFSFAPMDIFASSDLEVFLTDEDDNVVQLAEGNTATTYSVQMNAGFPGTGQITYPASGGTAIPATAYITIKSVQPLLQNVKLERGQEPEPKTQEYSLDRATLRDQQITETVDRALKLGVTDISGCDVILPTPVPGKLVRVSSDGQSFVFADYASTFQGDWATGIEYQVGDIVRYTTAGGAAEEVYYCLYDHVSTAFTDDKLAGLWALMISSKPVNYYVAFQALSAYRIVLLREDETLTYAHDGPGAIGHWGLIPGMITQAVSMGASTFVVNNTVVTNPGWSFTARDALFVTTNGQVVAYDNLSPNAAVAQPVGTALNSNTMFVTIGEPTRLFNP